MPELEPDNDRYEKHASTDKVLAIIVPYRDRAKHLEQFLPHMVAYFQRDKLDRHITYSIHIVEQTGDGLFNRGKLCNCGYDISKESADYVCFHDVDYLPVWSDYAYCDSPTHLIWYGINRGDRVPYPDLFGGVTLFNKADFETVNGFSNEYWGWGFEDEDLKERCRISGLTLRRRSGTYLPLLHENAGFNADGSFNDMGEKNQRVFHERREDLVSIMKTEGLNSLDYELESSSNISRNGVEIDNLYIHKVTI